MKPTQEQVQEFVDRRLEEWSFYALSALRASMVKNKMVVTEELLQSLASNLKKAAGSLGSVELSFNNEGRFLDMRNRLHRKPMPSHVIEGVLLEWVKAIGVNKFKYVPGYNNPNGIDQNRAANRIAWGIGKGRIKYLKPSKRWYAKKMGGLIITLAEWMVTDYATVIASSTAHQLSE